MAMTDKPVVIPDMPELEFDDSTHTYKLNGLVIPSVTTIMKPLKEALYDGISEKTLKNAAGKGTEVHNAIENWIKFGIEDVTAEHKGYFDAFLGWWDKEKPELIGSEIRMYHRLLRYGGTVDLLAYIKGKITLVDYKSTYAISDMSCGVQVSAYENACVSHGIPVEQKMILHLKRNGTFDDSHRYPVGDAERWRAFGALKSVYDYIQSYR